jgi:hypothetical protein
MNKVFNTPFETGLRLLLVLYTANSSGMSIDRLVALDFMALYGKDFNISKVNLNGMNGFNFSELPTRREICIQGMKEFALDGLVDVTYTKNGFKYKISKNGIQYVEALNSDYAKQYVSTLQNVLDAFGKKSDAALVREINNKAVEALRR